ncbi:hypothetical protein PCASD_18490 [Puccinia coronata f. sp. avenae]|uniref:C2H2-type domain-containing protein n=1 Tax=Puccinia coronata f. sp. avenae TaxID=200324 RepID=A0A2N5SVU0_9BASI|nr:hypothetical protein PCASD_18490 [Puccinia coronata f. sp. avenae]
MEQKSSKVHSGKQQDHFHSIDVSRKTAGGVKDCPGHLLRGFFIQQQKLMNHLHTHTGNKPFQYEMCGKTIGKMTMFFKHCQTHANKMFLEPSNLSKHMCIHLLVKKFQCKICGKHFTRSNQLSCHTKSRAIDSQNPLSAPHLPQDDDHQNHNNNKEEDRALQEKLGSQVPKPKHQKCMSCGPA